MTSITVSLPEEDLARLRAIASLLGRTPEQLVVEGIERLLQRSDAEFGSGGQARRITELQGLGREIWRGMDAQEYVQRERNAWGG